MGILSEMKQLRLAFWAKNMLAVKDARMDWPGFSYTDDEWLRMERLAAPVTTGPYLRFIMLNAVIFIAIAAIVIVAAFLPLATWLFPVPAETPALDFTLLLAATAFLTIGIGLPISMALAAWLSANAEMRARIAAMPPDEPLAAKVAFQLRRITLIMCGLLVPGVLLFIAYDIDGGPILTVLKLLAAVAMGLSLFGSLRKR